MKMNELEMRLDLFGEGTEGTVTESAAAAPEAGDTGIESEGVSGDPAREGSRPKIFPAVEKQPVNRVQQSRRRERPQPSPMAAQQAAQAPAEEETFERLIRGKYKNEYGQAVQQAIQQRFKNQQDSTEQLNKTMAALRSIAPLYQIEVDEEGGFDLDKLVQAVQDDDRLYEEEALSRGVPVSTMKQLKQLENRERMHEMEQRRSLEQEHLRQHVEQLRSQEQELKKDFPDFDLMKEVQANPAFARMTAPGGGLTLRQAYMAVHGDELMQANARQVESKTKQNMSRAIQAGSVRPQENGMAQSGGGQSRIDPLHMSRAEREEIRRRVRNGERIVI